MAEGSGYGQALQDFQRARQQAAMEQIVARLTGQSVDLLSYQEVRHKLKARESAVRVLKDIPLDAIVGSVGRYTDFTRSFLPRQDSDADRWARVELANADTRGLPPIEVYQIGQVYFVADGNHRVSVARQQASTHIQAYVTEVHSRVPLSPDVKPDDLIVKAEYADFLEWTRLDQLRPGVDLTVSIPGQYGKLENHIEVHRYLMETERRQDIPFDQAVAAWYDQVYQPVVQLIYEQGLLPTFPGRTQTDLYVWVVEHRLALEKALGWAIRPESALTDLVAQQSPQTRRLAARVGWKMRDMLLPDSLKSGPAPGQWRTQHRAARRDDRLFADVMVAVNGEPPGWQALDQALVVARREEAWLHGLHVVTTRARQEGNPARAVQAEFARRCQAAGLPGQLAIHTGRTARVICQHAWYTDLVTLSLSYPPGDKPIARLRSGFRQLVQNCPRPVLAVPARLAAPLTSALERALLAYDGSPRAEEALYVATYLAARWPMALVVVSVAENEGQATNMLARARDYLEAHGVQASYVEQSGEAAAAILHTAEIHQCDWLIIGGYGFNPVVGALMGSVVDQVLRDSHWPVLICR